MSMTRQKQLDAVVRNYGEWPASARVNAAYWNGAEVVFTFRQGEGVSLKELAGTLPPCFTRAEVEARKAELQNKPSWGDAPDGSKLLAQNDHGIWCFGTHEHAKPNIRGGWIGSRDGCWYKAVQGEVIGDWRDTLEKLSDVEAKLKESADRLEEINRSTQDDRARLSMAVVENALCLEAEKDQPTPEEEEAFNMIEARNGNSGPLADEGSKWDGKGLPPVGAEFEYSYNGNVWGEGVMLFNDGITCLVAHKEQPLSRWHYKCEDGDAMFRPIKSDRDKWLDHAMLAAKIVGNLDVVEALMRVYDAGLAKMP